jgi:hypothetical protein
MLEIQFLGPKNGKFLDRSKVPKQGFFFSISWVLWTGAQVRM